MDSFHVISVKSDAIHGGSKSITIPIVQELAKNETKELPTRYIRAEEDRPSLSTVCNHNTIPVIDMDRLQFGEERQSEMSKLAMACEQWGFFQVVNHGVAQSLMDRMRGVIREFFELPSDEKKQHAINPGSSSQGYGQLFVASDDQVLDWADMIHLFCLPVKARHMNLWPTKPLDFSEKLGNKLLNLLAENLGIKPDYFLEMFKENALDVRMTYYPPCQRPDLVLGLSPHLDMSGITILLQDEGIEGLHIRKNGEWIPVQPIPGALVINIGDMLEAYRVKFIVFPPIMSNGIYKSAEHRVVTNKEKERISIAAFYNSGSETDVGPAPDFIDDLHPCLYRKFKRLDYVNNFFNNKLDGKKAIDFVKIHCSV
eukprot:Gb_26142 [translate_table: standard]